MDSGQISTALLRRFTGDSGHVIFWNDPEGEFAETIDTLLLPDIELIKLNGASALHIKQQVLRQPKGRFLLYSSEACPLPEHDWLLDLRLREQPFAADRASMLLNDLGLAKQSLREHLKQRKKFLASKERVAKLKQFVQTTDTELDLDRKMLAVIAQSDQAQLFSVLIAVLSQLQPADLGSAPEVWREVEKYQLAGSFWSLVQQAFEYQDDDPTLERFVLRLFISELAQTAAAPLPESLEHLCFNRKGRANANVCLAHWRDSATRSGAYEALATSVASALSLEDQLNPLSITALQECTTVLDIDRLMLRRIRDELLSARESADLEAIAQLCSRRLDAFWVTGQRADTPFAARSALRAAYHAILQGMELLTLAHAQRDTLESTLAAKDAVAIYCNTYYRFDQCYRIFSEHVAYAAAHDWDVLKGLADHIEDLYGNRYLARLGLSWGKMVESELLESWRVDEMPSQQQFFHHYVRPILEQGDDRRVYVIISDALRYEAAEELNRDLNGRYRIKASLEAQLGVLPSYTGLGMASLLPHEALTFNDKGIVHADGISTAGLAQRSKILARVQGIAIKAPDLMNMTKDEGRSFIKPHRVVYIYHDRIDAVGDSASTESQTFEAVRGAIDDLRDLVGRVINSLNGAHVLVTADHGFLFQQRLPEASDRSSLIARPEGTLIAKKRYVIGRELGETQGVYHGSIEKTSGAGGDMEYWVPKSSNRFHFVGGARFVHGGAMPQEVIVPVIRVHQKRGEQAAQTKVKRVGVNVLGTNFKITTNRHVFNLIQTEAVSERVKPVTLNVGVYESNDPVTNIETITFSNTSKDMNEWKRTIRLTLQSRPFDRSKAFFLIMRDAETGVEAGRYEVTIDLAFFNDF